MHSTAYLKPDEFVVPDGAGGWLLVQDTRNGIGPRIRYSDHTEPLSAFVEVFLRRSETCRHNVKLS